VDRRWKLGLIYGIVVGLLMLMGGWWVYFLTHEGAAAADVELQRLATERLHATFLLRVDPEITADPEGRLGEVFPSLRFRREADGTVSVAVDSTIVADIRARARRRRNMFLWEGLFFLLLLAAAATILLVAVRREQEFKRARELFLAGATHEFKTPLASLRLYTETLDRTGLAETDRARIRASMVDDIRQLEGLVNQVLALSGDEMFREEPRRRLDLAEECRTVLNELSGYIESQGALVTTELPDGHAILGQRLALGLALRNLIQNAIKFSPRPARVAITLRRRDRWHELSVADRGPGIPRKLQRKVFECFYSGSDRRPGAGLGLYLVRRSCERMGGRVELESTEGAGATFRISLPAYEGDEP
jgi:signal transduction histidine kinase